MDMEKGLSNKTEYIYADYFRLICAIGIVALHLDPFYDINEYVNFFVGSVLTRLCVPFFFLLSGFFLKDKLSDWNKTKRYVRHLIRLYLVYTVLYIPVVFYEFKNNGKTLKEDIFTFIRNIIFVGSYGQLWYFLALIFAVVFLCFMTAKIKIKEKTMIIITVVLFLIGLFFRVYDKPVRDTVDAIKIVELYDSLFKTTRNGLFFGTPFVYWGNLIWKKNISIDRKKCGILFALSLMAMMLEAIFVRNIIGARQLDMLILLPITTVLMICLILSKVGAVGKSSLAMWCRKMSVLIFGFHLLIFFAVDRVCDHFELLVDNMTVFFVVLVINFAVAAMIIFLSENKYCLWMKKVLL